jgi:hypothetical protein
MVGVPAGRIRAARTLQMELELSDLVQMRSDPGRVVSSIAVVSRMEGLPELSWSSRLDDPFGPSSDDMRLQSRTGGKVHANHSTSSEA